jgi:hypothetical protein
LFIYKNAANRFKKTGLRNNFNRITIVVKSITPGSVSRFARRFPAADARV